LIFDRNDCSAEQWDDLWMMPKVSIGFVSLISSSRWRRYRLCALTGAGGPGGQIDQQGTGRFPPPPNRARWQGILLLQIPHLVCDADKRLAELLRDSPAARGMGTGPQIAQ
jgi:hypothetical protein